MLSVAYHTLEQRLASAEERCSTISQHFSISNSTLDSKPAEEMVKTNCHFSEVVGSAYFSILSLVSLRKMNTTLHIFTSKCCTDKLIGGLSNEEFIRWIKKLSFLYKNWYTLQK